MTTLRHSVSLVVTRCITLCHLLYHSFSFVVTCCHSFFLVVARDYSLYVTLACLFTNDRSETLKAIFNNCLIKAEFPNELTPANVIPILKREYSSRVKNYRPVIVLPTVSKVSERIYTGRLVYMLISFYHFLCVAIEKALVHNKYYCH